MSKKERIEYLETQVAGLNDKVSELIAKVEELEKKQASGVFIPFNQPVITNTTGIPQRNLCPWCHKEPANQWHLCPNYPSHWVDPNGGWTNLTLNNKTEVLK